MWNVHIDHTEQNSRAWPHDPEQHKVIARHIYEHRTAKAALRRLGSVIAGKLRRKHATAQRFYVLGPDNKRYTYNALKEYIRVQGIERV